MRHLLLGTALVAVLAITLGQNLGTPSPSHAQPAASPTVNAVAVVSSSEPTGEIGDPLTGVNPALIVPECEEDQVIVGFGDYSDGYWATYQCVAVEEIAADVNATTGDVAISMARLALKAEPDECKPVVKVGTFIGCEIGAEGYAGLIWVDGRPVYDVGP